MCVFAIRVRVSCSIGVPLAVVAGGIGCQVIVGLTLPILRFAESYLSISVFSFADDGLFLIIFLINFRFLPDLIRYRPTFKFKPIIINFFSRSSNVVAEGIRRRNHITRVLSPLDLNEGGGGGAQPPLEN